MTRVNLSIAEFEKLVDEVKGDCDRCKVQCFDRLLIIDSQIRSLRALEDEYRGVLNEVGELVAKLRGLYQINMRVLNIVKAPEKAGAKNETDFTRRFGQR